MTSLDDSGDARRNNVFIRYFLLPEVHDGANNLTLVHVVEGLVDLVERSLLGHEVVNVEIAAVDVVNVLVQLAAGLHTTESSAGPLAASHELEGTSSDLSARGSDADDDGSTPALVSHLEGSTHGVHIADGLEGVVHTTVGETHNDLLDRLVVVLGVDAVGGTHLGGEGELVRVDVNGDDARRTSHLRTLDRAETNTAEAKHGNGGALLDLGGVDDAAEAGGDAAAHEADLGRVRLGVDLHDGDVGEHSVLGKGGAAHEVSDGDLLVAVGLGGDGLEAGSAVGHHTLALSDADLLAEVSLGVLAELAFHALGNVGRDNEIANSNVGDALTDRLDDGSALVTKNAREHTFGVEATKSVGIGVADTRVKDLHTNLVLLGWVDHNLLNGKRLLGLPSNGSIADWIEGVMKAMMMTKE